MVRNCGIPKRHYFPFAFGPVNGILSRNARFRTALSVLFIRSAIATGLSPDVAIFLRKSSSVVVQGWRIPLIIYLLPSTGRRASPENGSGHLKQPAPANELSNQEVGNSRSVALSRCFSTPLASDK